MRYWNTDGSGGMPRRKNEGGDEEDEDIPEEYND